MTEYNWEEARIHVQALLAGYKGFEHAESILGAATEASHELTIIKREIDQNTDAVKASRVELETARNATTQAKRLQKAAEQAAQESQAKAAQYQVALDQQMRDGEATFTARAQEQEQALAARRATVEKNHQIRMQELADEQAKAEGRLAETRAALIALGIDPAKVARGGA